MVAEAEQSEEEREAAEGFSGGRAERRGRGHREPQAPRVESGAANFPRTPEGQAARAAHGRERERLQAEAEERAERERLAQERAVELRAQAAERYRASRNPAAFQFRITPRSAGADADLNLELFDEAGGPLTRIDDQAQEQPLTLVDYFPELKDEEFFKGIKRTTVPDPEGRSLFVDEGNVLRISAEQLRDGTQAELLLPIVTTALEQVGKKKMDAAKEKFEAAKAKLLKLHEKEERTKGYEKAEKAYRESVEHIFHEREHRLQEILKEVFKDQNIDLAGGLGGTDTLLETRQQGNKRWMEEHLIFPEHHEEKKWHSAVSNLPSEFVHSVHVEQALLDKKYEKLEHEIEALPDGVWNNLRKSSALKAFRDVRRSVRKASQWVKPAIATPLSAGATVGAAVLIGLGKLGKYLFEKPWAAFKELANEFSFDQAFKDDGHGGGTPKKKSGGGGGGHH